ncbi:hypothetical protein GW17_00030753 [Ensete ventricosum]|uniref:Uncharacterized protein n=1 Tax=Ensete ventricosum TaxID=4639 RepID=A0A427APH5_ENSVE|nr:hypothetical protein B296_00003928 [Ensete ventricosum]RWW05950.1 hypothetical protein GW17_00030753 [Ensete ventricosum]
MDLLPSSPSLSTGVCFGLEEREGTVGVSVGMGRSCGGLLKELQVVSSWLVDPSELLANIEAQIVKVKEESISRKDITDRISKWLAACEEENWLEEYSQKLHSLLLSERDAPFGSKPVAKRSNSLGRKPSGYQVNGFMTPAPRRLSAGSATPELLTPRSYSSGRHNGYFKETRRLSTTPLNFVAIPKDDSMSTLTSVSGSEPESPLLNRSSLLWDTNQIMK